MADALEQFLAQLDARLAGAAGPPEAVFVALHTPETLARFHPFDHDFAEWQRRHGRLKTELALRLVPLIEVPAAAAPDSVRTSEALAHWVQHRAWRPGEPYRLGLSLAGATRQRPRAAIGWFILGLGDTRGLRLIDE